MPDISWEGGEMGETGKALTLICPECGQEEALKIIEGKPICKGCLGKLMRLDLLSLEREGLLERVGENGWRLRGNG